MPERIPLLSRRTAPAAPRARASDFGSGAGVAAAGEAARAVAGIGAAIVDNYERSRAQRSAAETVRAMRERAAEILAGPDARTWETEFGEATQTARQEHAEDLSPGYSELYDQAVRDAEAAVGLEVRSAARKQLLSDASANDDYTLGELANEAARAPDDATRALVDQRAAKVLGVAKARGQWDQAEVDKRAKAYEKSVAEAALARGLADDPAGTRARLEAGVGPFGRMDEKDRQAGILAAEKRIAAAERASRAEARFQQAAADRARDQAVNAKALELENAARTGTLTPAMLRDAEGLLVQTSAGVTLHRHYSEALAAGGRKPPGAADPSYYALVVRERALAPQAFATRAIDPKLAGNQFEELVRSQGEILAGKSPSSEPFWMRVATRWDQVADVPWGFDLSDSLEGQFRLASEEARVAFVREHNREPNGVEAEEVLDRVVLDWTRTNGGNAAATSRAAAPAGGTEPRASSGGATPESAPAETPQAAAASLGVSTADLAKIDAQLRARGHPVNAQTRAQMRDAAIRAGFLVP